MKPLLNELRRAAMATLILTAVCCGVYPLIVLGIAQTFFREKANGSLVTDPSGTIRGSVLLGQSFTSEKYFHPRPSNAGAGYDATNSGGSNLGPTSRKLHDAIQERVAAYRRENELGGSALVPADAVTASGSGLDPHISPQNARLQASRVSRARHLRLDRLLDLVQANTDLPDLGFLGEPGVNVLKLNMALDTLEAKNK
jgi:K+-transporting ATPase ATPase C chain